MNLRLPVFAWATFAACIAGACDLSYLGPGTNAGDASGGDANGGDASQANDAPTDVVVDVGPGSSCGTITTVQAVPGTSLGQVMENGGSQSHAINEGAGHLLVAIVYSGQGPGSSKVSTEPNMTFTVTDQLGNDWYAGPFFENALHHQSAIQIFFAPNIKAGANVVMVTTTQPGPALPLQTGLLLQEYAGVATTDVVDVSVGQSAPTNTAQITPGAMTTLTGCDLVVGAFTDGYVSGQNLQVGTGWTYRSTDDWCPAGAVDDMPTGAPKGSSVDPVMLLTGGSDDGWVAVQTAFRAADAPALPQPTSVVFTSAAQTLSAGDCSKAVTVAPSPLASATGIPLTLSGSGLSYFADPLCKYPITSTYLGAGAASQSFFFTATSGSQTVNVTPKGMSAITQAQTIN